MKQQILDEIQRNTTVFIKVSPIQYRIRCPICGDSQKNLKDAHCYIKCTFDPTEPLLYNCFKCNSGGIVNSRFLQKLNINSDLIDKVNNQKFNKIGSIKSTNIDLVTGSPVMNSNQVKYIEYRLGSGFTSEDYDKFKILWNIENVYPYVSNIRTRNTLPNNNDSISFLSDDKSMMLTRSLYDNINDRWRKIKLFPSENKSFYTIKTTLNIFTEDTIIVNIAEGIMDILSIYKNFNDCENSVFIATLGSDYVSGVEYALVKGIIGTNVEVRIYVDNDINERDLKYRLKKYKWLFKSITILKNIMSKDVGVAIENIKLIEQKI